MGRTFTLEIKQGGVWQRVTAVFPFISGELLDERLDEGSITFFDRTKAHKPLTEFRIAFYKGAVGVEPDNDIYGKNTEYFILANDNSAEYPVGSGVYKHEAYLIERTKLLEGIICPSITFTNKGVLQFKEELTGNKIALKDIVVDDGLNDPLQPSNLYTLFVSSVPVALEIGKTYNFPTPKSVCEDLAKWLTDAVLVPGDTATALQYFGDIDFSVYTQATYYIDGVSTSTLWAFTPKIKVSRSFEITYDCCIQLTSGKYRYKLKFNVYAFSTKLQPKPYTITDCVNRVLELAEPLTRPENPKYTFEGVTYNAGISNPGYEEGSQAEKYDKITAPEFSMTQSTLREQLKVIGSYIHAEPYLDENDVVHFLEYGRQNQSSEIDANTPYVSNTLKTDINQHCTEIRSNAQNLVSSLEFAKGVIIDPGSGLYRSLRTETMYARINEENGYADTEYPIYAIQSVFCGVASGDASIGGWLYNPVEITPYVFEETEYSANLSSFGGGYPTSKAWAIYYTQGKKGLRGLFHQNPDAASTATYSPWAISNILSAVNGTNPKTIYNLLTQSAANLVFQITYKPIAPAFISHGKQYYISGDTPYTQIYNQGDNLIETQYYGENMKGVAARLGNIEQERTYLFKNRSQIPRIGDMIDDYSISAVSCEYLPDYIKCTVGLSKDFQRISEYVGISSVKRMYEVSERQAHKRDILIKNVLLISDIGGSSEVGGLFGDNNLPAFLNAFTSAKTGVITNAVMSTYMKGNAASLGSTIKEVIVPCIGRSFGNSVHFAFTMKDNYSAGSATVWGEEGEGNNKVTGRWQSDVPYGDYYGRAYWARIRLSNSNFTSVGEDGPLPIPVASSFTIPSLDGLFPEYVNNYIHRLRKDNREIIGYNLEIEYKTDPDSDIIIGSELASRCRYISDDTSGVSIYLTNQDINKFDSTFVPDEFDSSSDEAVSFFVGTEKDRIVITVRAGDYQYFKNWVIVTTPTTENAQYVDEDGNVRNYTMYNGGKILLAGSLSNSFETLQSFYRRTLHFYFKRS